MKKLAIILAMLMIPSFAFALDTISDSDLNDVTGQAGVSILINSVTIVKSSGISGYGDPDDFAAKDNWVNIVQQMDSTMKIGFHGTEPLMIDIVDVQTINGMLASLGADPINNIGIVGVEIKLPDMIEIQSTPQLDGIYMNNTPGSNDPNTLMLYRYSGGGTTKIIGDLNGDGNYAMGTTNFQQLTTPTGNAQTAIIITTH